jgi:transposase
MDLTSSQWSLVAPLVAQDRTLKPRGRPRQDARAVLNGIFWVMRTGARWADLPDRYPPHQTCHRRFRAWLKTGALAACLKLLADDMERRSASPDGVAERDPCFDGDDARRPSQVGAVSRSWRWHTALLLQSPLGRETLREVQDRSATDSADPRINRPAARSGTLPL